MNLNLYILSIFFTLSCSVLADERPSLTELEQWLNDDSDLKTAEVNEGKLEFLASPPAKAVLHSINELRINQNSIDNGWVKLRQCYQHLDPFPTTEVVYHYKQIRNLELDGYTKIGTARVQGQSIQLEDVEKGAELCIRAEVRIFYQNTDGSFSLVNGPFHRRFLDGYYPYHVTLKINYPARQLEFIRTQPVAQLGFIVEKTRDLVTIDSYFEGILITEIHFKTRDRYLKDRWEYLQKRKDDSRR